MGRSGAKVSTSATAVTGLVEGVRRCLWGCLASSRGLTGSSESKSESTRVGFSLMLCGFRLFTETVVSSSLTLLMLLESLSDWTLKRSPNGESETLERQQVLSAPPQLASASARCRETSRGNPRGKSLSSPGSPPPTERHASPSLGRCSSPGLPPEGNMSAASLWLQLTVEPGLHQRGFSGLQ